MNAIETVKVYRSPECPLGKRAIDLLEEKEIEFEDIKLRSQQEIEAFKAKHQVKTTPQIFFGDRLLGGYSDLAEYFQVEPETEESSYTPVVAVFSTAALMDLATSSGMFGFMGISLSMLASLKLMDLDAFVASFEKYDIVTKKFKPYAKVYPFAELSIGLGFISGILPTVTGIGSFAIGAIGLISVFKAVYIEKLKLNCACVGGKSKAPLGIVSKCENAIMAVMGIVMVVSTFYPAETATREVKIGDRSQLVRYID